MSSIHPGFAACFTAGVRAKDPMTTRTQVRFGNWEVGEIGAKVIDCGFDFLELVRGWGTRIVGKRWGIRIHLSI
jgi:hypothetical protein